MRSSKQSLPSFEEYAQAVMGEMESREMALLLESMRVTKAGKRGGLGEMPMAKRLLLKWQHEMTEQLKYDHKMVRLQDCEEGLRLNS